MNIIYRAESLYDNRTVTIGFFTSEDEAIKAAKKQGITPNQDGKVVKTPVFDSFQEFRDTKIGTIRERAEAKLTEDEIEVLKNAWKQDFAQNLGEER